MIFIILGVVFGLLGGFLLVYGVFFVSVGCYKVGGGFLMILGKLFFYFLDINYNYKIMCISVFFYKIFI